MENVNKQLLDAAKSLVSALNEAMPHMQTDHEGVGPDCTKQFQALIDGAQAISAAEQAQAEPRCACGDSFTSDSVCANCLAAQPPAVADRDAIRRVFMAHGFTIKDGQTDLKPYVYEAAEALLRELSPAVPEGYALVPIDPTPEMIASVPLRGIFSTVTVAVYGAMLEAYKKAAQ